MRPFLNPMATLIEVILISVGLAALSVLFNALMPDFLRRARDNAAQRTGRSFLIGLINFLFFGLIAVALLAMRMALIKLIGVIVATIVLSFVAVGIASIALWVGERLRPGDTNMARQVLAGIITLELAELFPFVGWIVVPLLGVSTGLGAVILTLFQRKTPAHA